MEVLNSSDEYVNISVAKDGKMSYKANLYSGMMLIEKAVQLMLCATKTKTEAFLRLKSCLHLDSQTQARSRLKMSYCRMNLINSP